MVHKLLLFMVLSLLLVSCHPSIVRPIWSEIENREFSNLESFAGSGFYFHEEDHIAFCTYMVYGSGLPLVYAYKSEIEFEGNTMRIKIPSDLEKNSILKQVTLRFENGTLVYEGHTYEDLNLNNFKYIKDLVK